MIVALKLPLTVVVITLKVDEVAPAGTVVNGGTVRVAFVFVKATFAPPVGAGCVNVTVQVVEEFGPRLARLQASEDTKTGATRLTVVLAELLL